MSTKTLQKVGLARVLGACYHACMQNDQFTSTVAQAVNQALIDAMDNCAAFDWLPNMGYYSGVSMWA